MDVHDIREYSHRISGENVTSCQNFHDICEICSP